MNESTISSAEMSIRTPRAPVGDDALGQVVLQRHRQPVVHVDLDGDEQERPILRIGMRSMARPQPRGAARVTPSPTRCSATRERVGQRRLGDHVVQIDAEVHDGLRDLRAGCR